MTFRGQPFSLHSPDEAIAALLPGAERIAARLGDETASLPLGRVLAQSVVADRDSPPFDYSAMDGYACRAEWLAGASGPVRLAVVGEARIGSPPPALTDRRAIRISTGAPIPSGADAVVRREDVQEIPSGDTVAAILIKSARPGPGDNIRRRAENARAGEVLVPAGELVSPAIAGVLAAVGLAAPRVRARLRVSIIVTGDELTPPELDPGPFQIRDSNGPALAALLDAASFLDVLPHSRGNDDVHALAAAIELAARASHAVILSGGVSMGHRDPVRRALELLGARILFHGLPQRPGKPILAAELPADPPALLFALPGNPVSALVTCTRVVLPVLAAAAGLARLPPPPAVRLANPDGKSIDLWWHRLVRLRPTGDAELIESVGSGDFVAAARADGFVEVPPRAGDAAGPFRFFAWPQPRASRT